MIAHWTWCTRGKVLPQHGGGDAPEETKKPGTEAILKSKSWVVASVLSMSPLSFCVSMCDYEVQTPGPHFCDAVNSLPLIFVPSSKLNLFEGRKAYASRGKIKLFWKSFYSFIFLLVKKEIPQVFLLRKWWSCTFLFKTSFIKIGLKNFQN